MFITEEARIFYDDFDARKEYKAMVRMMREAAYMERKDWMEDHGKCESTLFDRVREEMTKNAIEQVMNELKYRQTEDIGD